MQQEIVSITSTISVVKTTNSDNDDELHMLLSEYGDLLLSTGKCPTCFRTLSDDNLALVMEGLLNEHVNDD